MDVKHTAPQPAEVDPQRVQTVSVNGFAKFESCPERKNIFPMYFFLPVTPKTKTECGKSDTCCFLKTAHNSFVNGAFISFRTWLYALIKMSQTANALGLKKKSFKINKRLLPPTPSLQNYVFNHIFTLSYIS